MSNHTQGEWKKWHSGYTAAPFVIYVGEQPPSLSAKGELQMNGSAYIGTVSSETIRTNDRDDIVQEGDANARLFTAAPELLEALKRIDAACAQIPESIEGHLEPLSNALADARAAIAKATVIPE